MVRPSSQMPAVSRILRIFAIAISLWLVVTYNLRGVAGITGSLLGALKLHHGQHLPNRFEHGRRLGS